MSAAPRPWTVSRREPGPRGANGGYDIYDARNFPVLILPDGEVNKQKAYDIVRAINREPLLEEARAALEFLLDSNALGRDCNNQRFDGGDEWVTNVDAFRHAKAVLAKLQKED